MTILGDANQSVNPYSSTKAEDIQKIFAGSELVVLNKSYRSTLQIAQFAQRISPNEDLEVIERHGKEPEVLACKTEMEELDTLIHFIRDFEKSDHQSLGVICKTAKKAKALHQQLRERDIEHFLITEKSRSFKHGTLLTHAHLAKGLEFDRVIIPHIHAKNYRTEVDRCMLYIACTRAMHELSLTYTGKLTDFIKFHPGYS
nr:ATP-binding domain-containing protein [Saprospiraceae bacterium]